MQNKNRSQHTNEPTKGKTSPHNFYSPDNLLFFFNQLSPGEYKRRRRTPAMPHHQMHCRAITDDNRWVLLLLSNESQSGAAPSVTTQTHTLYSMHGCHVPRYTSGLIFPWVFPGVPAAAQPVLYLPCLFIPVRFFNFNVLLCLWQWQWARP